MVEKSKRRTQTSPGLGGSGLRPRHVMPSTSSPPDTAPTSPPTSGVQDRDVQDRASSAPANATAEKVSTRRPRTSRPPIRIDEVGDMAVAIAMKAVRTAAPKLLKTRGELTNAPIDHRDGFVISLIDGKMSVQAIVDISGMPSADILDILERLARLGIVALP
jgi:hypothetical protein